MSEFLRSEIVQKELYEMQRLYDRLSNIVEHLANLSKEEKTEFLEQTKMLIEKQKVFHARLKLASYNDEKIKEIVDNMDRLSMVFCGSPMTTVLNTMSDKLNSYLPS
jgi:mevalonate kinase